MKKLLLALRSRTFWTVVVMFVVNGVTGIREFIPESLLPVVDGVLGLLAIYFRINPRAK